MNTETLMGIMIPFTGTALGSACVFFMKDGLKDRIDHSCDAVSS